MQQQENSQGAGRRNTITDTCSANYVFSLEAGDTTHVTGVFIGIGGGQTYIVDRKLGNAAVSGNFPRLKGQLDKLDFQYLKGENQQTEFGNIIGIVIRDGERELRFVKGTQLPEKALPIAVLIEQRLYYDKDYAKNLEIRDLIELCRN